MDVKSLPLFKLPERISSENDPSGSRKTGLTGPTHTTPRSIADVFEKTPSPDVKTPKDAIPLSGDEAETAASEEAETETGGLKISFQFDLFYELSQKVSAKMGQKGLNRFTEVASRVTETFKGSFSLSIDPIGSFMKGTDASLEISPETTNAFLDSVDGLAALSPNALENFLRESDRFFAEIEKTYGSAGGAFDGIRDQIQGQAKQFFADVQAVQEKMVAGEPALPEGQQLPAAIEGTDEGLGLIPLTFGNGAKVSKEQYQDFLKGFQDYVNRFRQQMMKDFLGSLNRPPLGKSGDETATTASREHVKEEPKPLGSAEEARKPDQPGGFMLKV